MLNRLNFEVVEFLHTSRGGGGGGRDVKKTTPKKKKEKKKHGRGVLGGGNFPTPPPPPPPPRNVQKFNNFKIEAVEQNAPARFAVLLNCCI